MTPARRLHIFRRLKRATYHMLQVWDELRVAELLAQKDDSMKDDIEISVDLIGDIAVNIDDPQQLLDGNHDDTIYTFVDEIIEKENS